MPIYRNIFWVRRAIFFSLLLILATLSHFFDVPCLFRSLTGIPCPTCGVTRSFAALTRLDFAESFYYHPLTILILALLYLVLYLDTSSLSKKEVKFADQALSIGGVILFAVYLFRLYYHLIPQVILSTEFYILSKTCQHELIILTFLVILKIARRKRLLWNKTQNQICI